MTTFSQLGVPRDLADTLARRGVTTPFPVQEATIADAMAGRDVCGRAPTGSGKTIAFAVPLAVSARRSPSRRPSALVLVPTRELAAQVAEVVRPLAEARGRSVATFYGGTNIARDQRRLQGGVDIAIACPGRLADLVRRRHVDLSEVRTVVVDEADRMADMGFLPEVRRLLDATAPDRQTLLFSATLDGDVDVLIRRYQRDPVRRELPSSAEDRGDVRHYFWHAATADRVNLTRGIAEMAGPAMVFTRTKHAADRVAKQLGRQGVRAAALHGNRSQNQRDRALADFAKGRVAVLVATDLAARGIHVDDVGVVVHFDPPATDKEYVHRSGRTGRAGADGVVVTLVAPDRTGDVRQLQRTLSMRQHVDAAAVELLTAGSRGGVRLDPPTGDRRGHPSRPDRTERSKPSRGQRARRSRPARGRDSHAGAGRPRSAHGRAAGTQR